jgi:hypothetical protein
MTSTRRKSISKPQVINLKKQTQKEIADLYSSVIPDSSVSTSDVKPPKPINHQSSTTTRKVIPGIGRRLGSMCV